MPVSIPELIVLYLVHLLFWLWIIRWGGAEWLEGTFLSGLLIDVFAPRWSAEGIKLFGWGWLIVTTVLFVAGLFIPDFRAFI
jgi:hypothetical protein